jgi:hypothetical protein
VAGLTYEVDSDGEELGVLKLHAGDRYRVIECDDDAILIEMLGDAHNPYFVAGDLLRSISIFPAEPLSASE